MSLKNSSHKKIYFIGIKGVGMTMLAQFLKSRGHEISGSDIKDVFLTDKVLRRAKIKVSSPFAVVNIPSSSEIIIYSSAFNEQNNLELAFIKNNPDIFKKTLIISYAQALGEVFNEYQGIAVCGSHGKTTVTAWLGYVLAGSGLKPNVLVGSNVPQLKGSSLSGTSKYLLAEVDEYQNKLQYFKPWGVLLNNIDYDHPDFFKTPKNYFQTFCDFIKKIPTQGWLLINADDPLLVKAAKYCRGKVITYSLHEKQAISGGGVADYVACDLYQRNNYQIFTLHYAGRSQGEFKIALWGRHSVVNALAVIAAARQLKISWPVIKKYLASFQGLDRRTQILGRYRGTLIIDDYAHHPAEIKTTLAGLRARFPRRKLITVFHPHTFTRTKALFKDFVDSFSATDELIVLNIYGSAREKQGGVSSAQLVAAIEKLNRRRGLKQSVKNISDIKQVLTFLKKHLHSQDVLVLMGAGDVFRVGEKLLGK